MSSAGSVSCRFGTLTINVTQGDITEQTADAVVNAANNQLWMGGGVAGAIKRRGGEEIEREAMARGPIEPGAAVATTAGRLKAKYCIHAATMGQNLETDAALIGRATRSALEQAARLELNTVAFPALGTGVGGFPVDEAAQVMIAETLSHHQSSPLPGTVVFVLFDRRAYEAFSRALAAKPAT